MKRFCVDCHKEISRRNKTGRCISCGKKLLYKNPENNPNYKHGRSTRKNYCKDCGKRINWEATYCRDCFQKGERNHHYIDGRKNKIFHCKICNKPIDYDNALNKSCICKSCMLKARNWKGGITPIRYLIRELPEYIGWRKQIFIRDNYICQECGKKGGDLEVHHNKQSFSLILKNFLSQYSQFSPIEDKETLLRLTTTYQPFWDVDNGETLCRNCHIKTFSLAEV